MLPETANPQTSTALVVRLIDAIGALHPSFDRASIQERALYLASTGSVFLDGHGNVAIKADAIEKVKLVAPGLVGAPSDDRKPTKVQRAMARERPLAARVAASRKSPKKPSDDPEFQKRLDELPTLYPGSSKEARAARSRAREELWLDALSDDGAVRP